MATWNRNIKYLDGSLVVSMPGDGTGNPSGRTDGPLKINTTAADRPATIKYHASPSAPPNRPDPPEGSIRVTRLIPDAAAGTNPTYPAIPPASPNPPQSVLTVTDPAEGDEGYQPSFWYFVGGEVYLGGAWVPAQTKDPQIHNGS